jgi:hypothetical protein
MDQLIGVAEWSGNGDENSGTGLEIVQGNDWKADEPEEVAGLTCACAIITELELDYTALDLDEAISPFLLFKVKFRARRDNHDSNCERWRHFPAAQAQTPRCSTLTGHSCSVMGNVISRPNTGNKSGPNVVISTIAESLISNTSSVAARYPDSPQARM